MSNILEKLQLIGFAFVLLLLVWSFMGVASADEIVYEGAFQYPSTDQLRNISTTYQATYDLSASSGNDRVLRYLHFYDKSSIIGVNQIHLQWAVANFTPYIEDEGGENEIIHYSWFIEDVPLNVYAKSRVCGNVTHGYVYSKDDPDIVTYIFYFLDFNPDQIEGDDFILYLDSGDANPCLFHNVPLISAALLKAEMQPGTVLFSSAATSTITWLGYSTITEKGDPNHKYNIWKTHYFLNKFYIVDVGASGYYQFRIQRENLPGWDSDVASSFIVYDNDFLYFNQSLPVQINESAPLYYPGCCDNLYVHCIDSYDIHYYCNLSDYCLIPEIGYFDLSGYTRSVYGNLVPTVKLVAQDQTEYSNNDSYYTFEYLQTGVFDLAWNKTGYFNDSYSLYVSAPGEYFRDVVLIPLDALDTGEFGGLVYDRCSLDAIPNARVYLYNVTSGEEKYIYSNDYGFFAFPDLAVDSAYKVRASQTGYEESVVFEFVYNESNINETHRKTKNVWLLPEGGCDYDTGGVPTPSPSPSPTPTPETPIIDLFDMLGLGEYMNFILALLVILFCGGSFGRIGKGNEMAILVGAFFGFIVDVALGWLPRWLLALVIIVVVAFLAFQLKK